MIKCDFLVVGDNGLAVDAAIKLVNKNKKVVYMNASLKDSIQPDYYTIANILNVGLLNNTKLTREGFSSLIKLHNVNYIKNIEYLMSQKSLIILSGQPDFSSPNLAGIHSSESQNLVLYKRALYMPSAKNFETSKAPLGSILKPISDIFLNLEIDNNIIIITDNIDDIQTAFNLHKLNYKIILVCDSYVIEGCSLTSIKPKGLKIENIDIMKNLLKIYKKSNKKTDIYYNYNAIVNHSYYHLVNESLGNIDIYGQAVGQNSQSTKLNFDNDLNSNILQKAYEEKKFDLKVIVGGKCFFEYIILSRVDEIIDQKKLETDRLSGILGVDKDGYVVGMSLIIENKDLGYFSNLIIKHFKYDKVLLYS